MIVYTQRLAGSEVTINYPESAGDLRGFSDFLAQGDKVLGLDTETSGLDLYSTGYQLRLVQIGNAREAWVIRPDLFRSQIAAALRQPRLFTVHNAPFDLQVIDRHLGVKIEELGPRTFDTRILAHLLDPRAKEEGGLGHRLKDLAAVYVDPDAPDTEDGLSTIFSALFAAWKKSVTEEDVKAFTGRHPRRPHMAYGFANIPIEHETYVRYSGLDPILGRRLFDELAPMVREVGLDGLSKFEHHLQILLAIMQRKGVLLDVPYTEHLIGDLQAEEVEFAGMARRYGVENPSSPKQVAEALAGMGEELVERTPSGAVKVDKGVLLPLADLDQQWQRIGARTPNPLADSILRTKRADKWRKSYAQAFLDLRDGADRVHPSIGGLQARTGRMSISRPPLQQLPSGDWKIRRAFIADPGQTIIASDYSQVEMRVLAALCRDETLLGAIASGTDLHDFTAARVFGEGFTKAERKISKAIGFGKVYGGGLTTIVRQTGAPKDKVAAALAAYDGTFPGIKGYSRRLQRRAEFGRKEVVTPAGRHLPLDKDRLYAATNYVVQSTARDILAQAIVDIFDAGLGDHLLLPVHDELVCQAPAAEAADVIQEIGRLMDGDFGGVRIVSDPEVYGLSWGHGYGAPEEVLNAA